MKALIWVGGFVAMFVLKRAVFGLESLGGLGEVLFWSPLLFGAPYLCKKWDKRKGKVQTLEPTEEEEQEEA